MKCVAEPIYSNTQCREASLSEEGSEGWRTDDNSPIYYYIQTSFADKLSTCLENTGADGISTTQVINVVQAAAGFWNRESRSPILRYAGTINANDISGACSSLVKLPAIFVRFAPGCALAAGGGCRSAVGLWRYFPDDCCKLMSGSSACNVGTITIQGDTNTPNACVAPKLNWWVDGTVPTSDMIQTLVHEFGHALDLDHPYEPTIIPNTAHEAMNGGPSMTRRHLGVWERDCVDDVGDANDRGVRSLVYHWRGRINAYPPQWYPTHFNSLTEYDLATTKSFTSGGSLRYNYNEHYAFYHPEQEIWRSGVLNTDGYQDFTPQGVFSATIADLDVRPTLFSAFERSGSMESHRILYGGRPTSINFTLSDFSPPPVRYRRSDNWFVNSISTQLQEHQTPTNIKLQSSVGVSTAWDQVSENTVFVVVDSDKNDSLKNGRIRVLPGFYNGSEYILNPGSYLEDHTSPPSDPYTTNPDFDYTLRTDTSPGVACSDNTINQAYNCILAWQDRGIPDGRILYTYFRVNSITHAIEWQGTAWARSGVYTVSDVSAAWFKVPQSSSGPWVGAFWLAWKTLGPDPDVAYVSRLESSGYASGWSSAAFMQADHVVDAPTWGYDPINSREALLIWTELP